MLGEDFAYNGRWLSEFDMRMYDQGESQQFVGREINRSDITPIRGIPNHYSTRYGDTLVLDMLVCKNTDLYDSTDEMRFTADELNEVRSWLESPKMPTELKVAHGEDDSIDTCYFGIFTDVQPFVFTQECFGLYLTFTCNAPYGFSSLVSCSYKIASSVIKGSFYNHSSERCDYLKPLVEIISSSKFNGSEKLTIRNESDGGNEMSVTPPKNTRILRIDCSRKRVTDENGSLVPLSGIGLAIPQSNNYSFVSAETYLFYWLRFIYGVNELVFTTQSKETISEVKIQARYPRKSGGF